MFGKSYNIFRKFGLFWGFSFAVIELFSVKTKTKNHYFSYYFMFYLFSMPKNRFGTPKKPFSKGIG